MNAHVRPYQVVDLTPGRRVMLNMLDLSGPKHTMVGLLEVDVTVPRQVIEEHKARTGETLSFTGFLTFCLARAVDEDKAVQAYRKGRRQLALFDDVDVGVMIEHKVGEKKGLMGHVIRGANRKTYRQIHDEIRSVQSAPLPPNRGLPTWFRTAMLLPWPLSRFESFAPLGRAPRPGGYGVHGRYGQHYRGGHVRRGAQRLGALSPTETLSLVVGSIARKPGVVGDRIEPREFLNLTVMLDHDVIDGAPAARFIHRLVELIESGHGLSEADEQ